MMNSTQDDILKAYSKVELANENESATRLKVIDRILHEVLGWTDDDISPEEHVSEDGATTYADYILRTANTAIVVEAKKASAPLSVPKNVRRQKLTNAFVSGALGDAIIQARDYARKLGIDFAAVTNGNIWVVFPAQRHDQVTFQESFAIIFPSLTSALHDDFQEFYGLLSRDAALDGAIEQQLLGRVQNQFGVRKLGHAFVPSHRAVRPNPIYPLIEEAVVAAFSESIGDLEGELLEKCYVSTPETIKFDSRVRLYISKRDHLLKTQPVRPMKSSDKDVLRRKLSESISLSKPLAILLLGSVGAGKTTFLHYTRKVKATELFEKKSNAPYPHWIYIDFRDCVDPTKVVEFIYGKLREYCIEDDYFKNFDRCGHKAYGKEIDALRSGPMATIAKNSQLFDERVADIIAEDYKKVVPYVDRLFMYATKECAIFVAIDNVDQIESDEEQSKLFSEIISIGHKLGVNLVMSMRGSTYARHKNSPLFDAYDFDPLQIDAPRISSVLSKRFALARQLLEGQSGQFVAENGATIKLDNIAKIIELVQASVLGTEIGNRIEVLAADDVRLALRMTREFLEYGYSSPGKAIELYNRTGSYTLPKHEAFRAILLGNRNVYSEEYSPIANPFDSRLEINNAQLLRLYVLAALVNYASVQSFRHVDGTTIVENMRKIGFGDSVTLKVLRDLCRSRFVYTASQNMPDLHSSFFPSRLGGYMVRDLIALFAFLENVLFDTFIADNLVWDDLRSISNRIESERDTFSRVKLRVSRVRAFIAYLERLYLPLQAESQKRGLSPEWCSNPFVDARGRFDAELDRVSKSAQRNYGHNVDSDADAEDI